MCIIAIKPKGLPMFDNDSLATMFANNPDGAGYMYYDKKSQKVVIKKGFMTLKSLISSLKKQGNLTNVNVVLHFRITTSGYTDKLNCHPFPIYEANNTDCMVNLAMAHNGILYDYEPSKYSDINDTQVFIKSVLNKLKPGFIYDDDKKALIKELIGANKLAFLDNKGKVITIGAFTKDAKGYVYSNKSYLPRTHKCVQTSLPHVVYTPAVSTSAFDSSDCVYKDDEPDEFWSWWDANHPY